MYHITQITFIFWVLIILINFLFTGCGGIPVATKYVVTNDANGVYIRNVIPHGKTDSYLSEVERGVLRYEQLQNCSDIFISQYFKKCGANMNLSLLRHYFSRCEKRFNPEKIDYEYFTECHKRWEYHLVTSQERSKVFKESVDKIRNKVPKKWR